MKKIIFTHAVACICAAFIIPEAPCQITAHSVVLNIQAAKVVTPQPNSVLPVNTANFYRNAISIRAVRGFIKDFKAANNVTWYKAKEGGCSAQFVSDSMETTVIYDERGSCDYILIRYAENKMPDNVRGMVKRAFLNYSIMEITEFKSSIREENIIYSVLIKYADNYKVLKICKEEMKIVNDYIKP
jgi:hypothetical protein